jgi:hypothetical protein
MKHAPLKTAFLIGISAAVLSACGGSSSKSSERSASTNEVKTVFLGASQESSEVLETITLTGNEDVISENGITTVQVHAKENSDFSVGITLKGVTSTDENTLAIYFLESSVSTETFPTTITTGHGHAGFPLKVTGLIGSIECEYSGTLNNIDCNGTTLDLSQFQISEKVHVFVLHQDAASSSISFNTPVSIQFN